MLLLHALLFFLLVLILPHRIFFSAKFREQRTSRDRETATKRFLFVIVNLTVSHFFPDILITTKQILLSQLCSFHMLTCQCSFLTSVSFSTYFDGFPKNASQEFLIFSTNLFILRVHIRWRKDKISSGNQT